MALKSSLLWFRRNWRKTSSRFCTSRGPCTIRADFCRDRDQSANLGSWAHAPAHQGQFPSGPGPGNPGHRSPRQGEAPAPP